MKPISIPIFPKFKNLELQNKKEISLFTKEFPPYSDFNFTSLWSYNTENDVKISNLNNNLVIKFRDYITNEHFYSFIGKKKILKTVETLLEYAEKNSPSTPYLKLIPEATIQNCNELFEEYEVQEDKDNFDYILSIPEWSSLHKPQYFKQRKIIRRFMNFYPESTIRELDVTNNHDRSDILTLFDTWKNFKKRDDPEHELKAIKRTIASARDLDIYSVGLFRKSNLIGYLITDLSHPTFVQSHFSKYDPSYTGITNVLRQFMASNLEKKGYLFMNVEQDLGILTIRLAKKICRPVSYLKKYIIYR